MVKRSLQQDPRIDFQTLNKCFVETNSNISKTSALVLVFRGKAVVEFSDVGSVYAYNVTNRFISPILKGKRQIEKTDELKDTSLPILVESQGYYSWLQEEGRLTHRGEWESRLRTWLNEKVFASSNIAPNLYSSDDVFKAKPITYEKPKFEEPKKDIIENSAHPSNKGVKQPSLFDFEEETPGARSVNEETVISATQSSSSTSISKSTTSSSNSSTQRQTIPNSTWSTLDSAVLASSKWVFDGICQVVGTKSGFYLHIVTKHVNRYAKIKDHKINSTVKGSIWIKRPRTNDWCPVVYAINDQEINVGLIKYSHNRVLYRVSNERPDCKEFSTK